MKRLRDRMKNFSKVRYLLWRAVRAKGPITVELNTGEKLVLRQSPTDDLGIAYEVFMGEDYKPPQELDHSSVRWIVDLGANVGYTCVYWLANFPEAHVTAFEPHPTHVDLIRSNLEINGWSERVSLQPAAASTQSGELFLTDDGCRSRVVAHAGPARISVPRVDWFACVGDNPIDLLKIDIEGGEYDILADSRFASLHINAIVMEWHVTEDHPDGAEWCLSRLRQLGYSTHTTTDIKSERGMIWAFRRESSRSSKLTSGLNLTDDNSSYSE
jgi:FkbM family methyltransferase